jgi:hypothetical protein
MTGNLLLSSAPLKSNFICEAWRVLKNIISPYLVPDRKDNIATLYDFSSECSLELPLWPTVVANKVGGEDENALVILSKTTLNTFAEVVTYLERVLIVPYWASHVPEAACEFDGNFFFVSPVVGDECERLVRSLTACRISVVTKLKCKI